MNQTRRGLSSCISIIKFFIIWNFAEIVVHETFYINENKNDFYFIHFKWKENLSSSFLSCCVLKISLLSLNMWSQVTPTAIQMTNSCCKNDEVLCVLFLEWYTVSNWWHNKIWYFLSHVLSNSSFNFVTVHFRVVVGVIKLFDNDTLLQQH